MDEHDLESLYELIYKVVREDLKELGKDEEYVDYCTGHNRNAGKGPLKM